MPDSAAPHKESGAEEAASKRPERYLRQYELVERVRAYHPSVDEDMLNRAYVYAVAKHGSQKRASGDPYFSHPVMVAGLLADLKLDEQTITAGLLHDTVEDTDANLEEIRDLFGRDVCDLVDGVTKLTRLEYRSEETKQAENFQKFILASTKDVRVLLVKLADRLHNMRTLVHLKEHKRKRISRETMDLFAPLARRIGLYSYAEEMEDRAFAQINPEARETILHQLESFSNESAIDMARIEEDLDALMAAGSFKCRIKGRTKRPFSIWRKLENKSIRFSQISDIFAFRIIMAEEDEAECYRALGAIHRVWQCVPDRFRDFISVPKMNGYRSLHTTVRASGNQRVELQIRTEQMNETAERGVAAHWGYKNKQYGFDAEGAREVGLDAQSNLVAFGEMLAHGDEPEEFLANAKLEMYREHVFAFTPNGRLIVLPGGATPIDFAYAVHTDIGDTCIGAKIDGEERSLRTVLQNGDRVEILRGKKPAAPAGWESLAVSGRARAALRRLSRDQEIEEFRNLGRSLIDHSIKLAEFSPQDLELDVVAVKAGFETIEELYQAVGAGDYSAGEFMGVAFPGHSSDKPVKIGRMQVDDEHISLMIRGKDLRSGRAVHLGTCCSPVPGDRILGVSEPGKGLVVHVIDCHRLADWDHVPERWVDLKWTSLAETDALATGRIIVIASNQRGVLAKLCQAVANANGNITGLKTGERRPDYIDLVFEIEVEDLKRLTEILMALRSMSVVDRADRFRESDV